LFVANKKETYVILYDYENKNIAILQSVDHKSVDKICLIKINCKYFNSWLLFFNPFIKGCGTFSFLKRQR
jgi:hypothetical protein